jgi:non-ribosomal peptide synthetase component F
MVLLALYGILLSKICNQQDIVIGTPAAGRRHADLDQVMGMFVNTLAVRIYPGGEKTFTAFLQNVRKRVLKAFENQDVQFEYLVGKLVGDRDASRNPLFDVMFALDNLDISGINSKGLKLRIHQNEREITKFDLHLTVYEKDELLHFIFIFSTKLFKKESIENFIRYFSAIISSVINDPEKQLSQIQLVSKVEIKEIQLEFMDDLENE